MKNHARPFRWPPQGFTLIEILITIIIIGILSVIGISTYQSAQKKGRDFNRKAGLTAVMKALESYMNDKGVYPPSSPDGKILWCGIAEAPTVCPKGGSGGCAYVFVQNAKLYGRHDV